MDSGLLIDLDFVRREAGEKVHTNGSRALHRLVRASIGPRFHQELIRVATGVELDNDKAKAIWFETSRKRLRIWSDGEALPSLLEVLPTVLLAHGIEPAVVEHLSLQTGLWDPVRLDRALRRLVEGRERSGRVLEELGVIVIGASMLSRGSDARGLLTKLGEQLRRVVDAHCLYGHLANGDVVILSTFCGPELDEYGAHLSRWLQRQVSQSLEVFSATIPAVDNLTRLNQIVRRVSGTTLSEPVVMSNASNDES